MQCLRIIFLILLLCFFSGVEMPVNAFPGLSNKKEVNNQKAQPVENQKIEAKVEKTEKKLKAKIVHDPENPLGLINAENVVKKIAFYVEEGDFQSAQEVLNINEKWIYKATEYHTDLYKALSKVPNSEVQADIERDLAIKFAVLRDKTLFLGSKILIANGKKKEAVENLVEVVRSQPNTDLGFKAYKTLQDIGFTYKLEYQLVEEAPAKETGK